MRTYPKRLLTILLVLVMLVSMTALPAMAADGSTTVAAKIGDAEYATLSDAITNAADGAEITVMAGTHTLPGSINKNLTFVGESTAAIINVGSTTTTASGKELSFKNLTILKNNVNYVGFKHSAKESYANCVINGELWVYGTTASFETCTFNQTSSGAYNIWTYGSSTVDFNNCVFNSAGKSILVYNEGKTSQKVVNVNNCSINASQSVDGKAAIEIDSSLLGSGYSYTINIAGTTANGFDEGSVSGNTLWNNKKGNHAKVVVDGTTVLVPGVARVGDEGFETLPAAIAASAESGKPVELLADVTVANEQILTTAPLTLNGNGHTVNFTHTRPLRLQADATFNNVTLKNDVSDGRVIELRKGGITVTLNNSTVEVSTYSQALTVGGNGEGGTATVNINGSTIKAPNGYGIITFNPVNLNIANSSAATGYGALYMKGIDNSLGSAGSVVNVTGSTLSSTNNSSAASNEFGTIILQTGNIQVNVDAASTLSTATNGDCKQWVVLLNNYWADDIEGNVVTINCVPTLDGTTENAEMLEGLVANNNTIMFPYSDAIMAQLQAEGYDPTTDGETITVYVKHEHKLTKTAAVAATCTTAGNTEFYTCSVCNKYYSDAAGTKQITAADTVIPAAHKLTKVDAVAATCTKDGVNAHYTCSGCDKLFNDPAGLSTITQQQATAKAPGHKAVMGAEGKLPTCTEDGNIEYFECSCGALFTDEACKNEVKAADTVVAATGHKLTKTAAVAATCTTAGSIEYYTCDCGALFSDAEGKTAITTSQVAVAATVHKLTKVAAVAPTYTASGNTEHYACACGALFADAEGKTATTADAVKLPQLIEIKESTAEVSADAVDTAIKEAETAGTAATIVIDVAEAAKEEAAKPESGSETKPVPVVSSTALPVASLEKVAEANEEATLTVNMTEVTVTMDAKTMAAVAEQSAGETVTLKVEKIETKALTEKQQAVIEDKEVAVVVSATLISNNTAISDFKGGSVTIAVPFTLPEGTKGSDFQVYYVADDGTITAHDTEYKDGCLVFSTTHFSDYVVVNTADPTVPNTGDAADLMLHTTMLAVALIGLTALFIGKKKFTF